MQRLKPLLMAQLFSEVDLFTTLVSKQSGGLLPPDADPRTSKHVAKSGKLKVLKLGGDGQTWQSMFFLMVGSFLYYFKEVAADEEARDGREGRPCGGEPPQHLAYKQNAFDAAAAATRSPGGEDDEDEHEDVEGRGPMPWKGCVNLTYATVSAVPEDASKKLRVFRLISPLRTMTIKARHDLDAEDWMNNICAAQQGIPPKERHTATSSAFDVETDPLASTLKQGSPVTLDQIVTHPVAVCYFAQFIQEKDRQLASALGFFEAVLRFRACVVPEAKLQRATRIFERHVKPAGFISQEVCAYVEQQLASFDTSADLFASAHRVFVSRCQPHFEPFLESGSYDEFLTNLNPNKTLRVQREGEVGNVFCTVQLGGQLFIGRQEPPQDGRTHLQLWQVGDDFKVSREHCRVDVGALAVVVTDLGSSKGTRINTKDSKKVVSKALLPGERILVGRYELTYEFGVPTVSAPSPPSLRKGIPRPRSSSLPPGPSPMHHCPQRHT